MTDRNNLARDFAAQAQDDDPLAELARIVSGDAGRAAPAFRPRSYAEIARAKAAELQSLAERQAADVRRAAAAQKQAGIEEALMRELGFAFDEGKQAPQAIPEAAHRQPEPEPVVEPEPEPVAEPEMAAPAALSLEDQLMAELMSDAPGADPYADIWGRAAPEAVVATPEEFVAASRPEWQLHAGESSAGQGEEAFDAVDDPEAYAAAEVADAAPESGAHDDPAYDDEAAELPADSEASDWTQNDLSMLEAELDARGGFDPQAGDGASEAAEEYEAQFADELDRAYGEGEDDPYAVDLSDLELAAADAAAQGPVAEDELFRELAGGSDPSRLRRGTAAPAADALYGAAPADFLPDGVRTGPSSVASPVAAFDEIDFGEALEAEVAGLSRPTGAAPARASFAAPASPAAVDDGFAAAFAEELFELDGPAEAPPAPAPGGLRREAAGATGRYPASADRAGDIARPRGGDRGFELDADGAFAEAYYDDDPGSEPADEPAFAPAGRAGGFRRGFALAAAALGVALVVGGGALGYGYITSDTAGANAPLVVKADSGPIKVRPDNPGGVEVANQDKAVYEQVQGAKPALPGQEALVSGAEDPVDVAALATPANDAEPEVADPVAAAEAGTTDLATAAANADKAEARLSPGAEPVADPQAQAALAPRRVRTITVSPDGTLVTPPEPATAPEAPVAAPPAGRSAPAVTAFAPTAIERANEGEAAIRQQVAAPAVEPVVADSAPAQQQAAPRPAPVIAEEKPATAAQPQAKPAPAEPPAAQSRPVELAKAEAAPADAPATAAPWAVQLASQRSAEDAQATFKSLRGKFPDILGNRPLAVQRADVEGKGTFFRVRVPAQTKAEAAAICEQLKAAGGSCFVTR